MKMKWQRLASAMTILVFGLFGLIVLNARSQSEKTALSQSTPTPVPVGSFDQAAAIAKLKEQIKGKENDPAPTVFKNIQTMKNMPAGRLLAIMEFGFARSLGVDCTHCHTPDKWEAEDKLQKQIARDMSAMVTTINKDLLKNIKNLKDANPIVNCTTCHRGQVIPATNLPMPPKTE